MELQSNYYNSKIVNMEDTRNKNDVEPPNVYDTIPPNRNFGNGSKCGPQNQQLPRFLTLTCIIAAWIILLSIASVQIVCLMKLSDIEDNQKTITTLSALEDDQKIMNQKPAKTPTQGIDSPNDSDGTQVDVSTNVGNGTSVCSTGKVCEKFSNIGSKFRCYQVETDDVYSWNDAFKRCRSIGGFLAEISDQQSLDYVKRVIAPGRPVLWLGATDVVIEGTWIWATSQKPITVSDWYPGRSTGYGNEDCLNINIDHVTMWNNLFCGLKKGYICQSDRDTPCGWI